MGSGVVGIAVFAPKLHWDPAIAGGGQDEEERLEVRPMVLGVPIGDPRSLLAGDGLAFLLVVRVGVLAAKANARRVVVQLAQIEIKALGCCNDDFGEQRPSIRLNWRSRARPTLSSPSLSTWALVIPKRGAQKPRTNSCCR